jgi:hypothetical protein
MPAKTILAAASCPIGNWHQTDIYADDPIEDGSFSDEFCWLGFVHLAS